MITETKPKGPGNTDGTKHVASGMLRNVCTVLGFPKAWRAEGRLWGPGRRAPTSASGLGHDLSPSLASVESTPGFIDVCSAPAAGVRGTLHLLQSQVEAPGSVNECSGLLTPQRESFQEGGGKKYFSNEIFSIKLFHVEMSFYLKFLYRTLTPF